MKRMNAILGAVAGLLLAGAPSAAGAGFMYFKDSPIVGESTRGGKGGWIEVQSFQWATPPPAPPRAPAPAGIATGGPGRIIVVKKADKASRLLKQAAAKGTLLPSVEFDVRAATPGPQPYLQYKLQRCFVKSWSTSGDADDRPSSSKTETFALEYSQIELVYVEQRSPGALKAQPAVKK
jgi:type VI secretion system Hcp family effector